MHRAWSWILVWSFGVLSVMGYESMYARTAVDVVEIKQLPARRTLEAGGSGTYYQTSDGVFMKLFRYIDKHNVSMTVPVEVEIAKNRMRFFAGSEAAERQLPNDGPVTVTHLPARTVVSAGLRGSYTEQNFQRGRAQAEKWLAEHATEWQADGEPYGVFWNSPFVPGFLKRAEVHIPVVPRK